MEINKDFKGKLLLAWDDSQKEFAFVSPKILTTTVYTEDGQKLDDLLKVTPTQLVEMVEEILKGAPEAYDTFLEVSKALDENKNSITALFAAIAGKLPKPSTDGEAGNVLILGSDGTLSWAEDKDTIYTHPAEHSASMIKETETRNFVTPQEKAEWSGKLAPDGDISGASVGEENIGNFVYDTLAFMRNLEESKGTADGLATLDATGKVPQEQLPEGADVSGFYKDFSISQNLTSVYLTMKNSSSSKQISIPSAKKASAGVMTAEDKKKLDSATVVKSVTLAEYQAMVQEGTVEPSVLYICG